MAILSALVSVAVLVYLVLRIIRLIGGTSVSVTTTSSPQSAGGIYDNRPKIPYRTASELSALLESMPSEWVAYPGATPPLKLKVRGLNEELYRRFTRNYFESSGLQEHLDGLPAHQKLEFMKQQLPEINAAAYVTDWQGAQYPNGAPLPFAPAHLASLMRQDDMLRLFVTEESARLSPNWS